MVISSSTDCERTKTMGRMEIVLVTSDVFPFFKTGGLADAMCGLASAPSENLDTAVQAIVSRYRLYAFNMANWTGDEHDDEL